MTEPAGIFLRVHRHPYLRAGCGMLQQPVAALPGSDLNESRSLEPADHLGPRHSQIVNLSIGFVNRLRDDGADFVLCDLDNEALDFSLHALGPPRSPCTSS